MPIKPPPRTYVCSNCGWRKTVAPQSDVRLPSDFVSKCQQCGNTALKVEAVNFSSLMSTFLGKLFR